MSTTKCSFQAQKLLHTTTTGLQLTAGSNQYRSMNCCSSVKISLLQQNAALCVANAAIAARSLFGYGERQCHHCARRQRSANQLHCCNSATAQKHLHAPLIRCCNVNLLRVSKLRAKNHTAWSNNSRSGQQSVSWSRMRTTFSSAVR